VLNGERWRATVEAGEVEKLVKAGAEKVAEALRLQTSVIGRSSNHQRVAEGDRLCSSRLTSSSWEALDCLRLEIP